MELSYDTLWKACTWFLLCFLVTRLVSLLVYSSSCDYVSGSVSETRIKRSAVSFNECNADDGRDYGVEQRKKEKKQGKSWVCGDRLMVSDGKSVAKRVKFDDKAAKVVNFQPFVKEVSFVRDVEVGCSQVNVVGDHDRHEKINDGFENREVGEEVVDHIVGFECEVGGEVGSCVEDVEVDDVSDEIVDCEGYDEEYVRNSIVQLVPFVGVGLGVDNVGVGVQSWEVSSNFVQKWEDERNNEQNDCTVGYLKDDTPGIGDREGNGNDLDLGCDHVDHEGSQEASSSNVAIGEEDVAGIEKGAVVDHVHKKDEGDGDGLVSDGHKDGDDDRSQVVSQSNTGDEKSCQGFDRDEGVLSDEDEWEGIERSELEKEFASAVNFVECQDTGCLANGGSDLLMELYALQKIAMEGPCYEPQPMAIKLSARAKWNAWQKLGNMNPEEAMQQYITLLSHIIPDSKEDHSSEKQ